MGGTGNGQTLSGELSSGNSLTNSDIEGLKGAIPKRYNSSDETITVYPYQSLIRDSGH
jgi:hypothetical protein